MKLSLSKTLILVILFSFKLSTSFGLNCVQDTQKLLIFGNYFGKNIYVLNPSKSDIYSVLNVFVNDAPAYDEILSNSFEIDLSDFKIGAQIKICIIYDPKIGTPTIYNPKDLLQKKEIQFTNVNVNRKNPIITWHIEGDDIEQDIELEHFRWNNWITIEAITPSEVPNFPKFETTFEPHSGKNLLRLKYTDEDGHIYFSNNIKFNSRTTVIHLLSDKVKTNLEFTDETQYEIFNMTGNLLLYGKDISVDVSELEKGQYIVNFDNKTIEFIKR